MFEPVGFLDLQPATDAHLDWYPQFLGTARPVASTAWQRRRRAAYHNQAQPIKAHATKP